VILSIVRNLAGNGLKLATVLLLCLTAVGAVSLEGAVAQAPFPAAPVGVRAIVDDDEILVFWDLLDDPTITSYEAVGTPDDPGRATLTCQATGGWCRLVGGEPAQLYRILVRARNAEGSGMASAEVAAELLAEIVPVTGVTAKFTGGRLVATWLPPDEIVARADVVFGVTVSTADGKTPSDSQTCETSATWCEFTGLLRGRRYVVAVVARVDTLEAGPAESPQVRVPEPPTEVTDVRVHPGDQSVEVTWDRPADDGGAEISHYEVSVLGEDLGCISTTESCLVSGLQRGGDYLIGVTAVNEAGAGPSIQLSTGKLPDVPGPVQEIELEFPSNPAATDVTVSWSPPDGSTSLADVEYRVRLWPQDETCVTTTLSCTFEKLDTRQHYRLEVVASNALGDGFPESSDSFIYVTQPGAPQLVEIIGQSQDGFVSGSTLRLSWMGSDHSGGSTMSTYRGVGLVGNRLKWCDVAADDPSHVDPDDPSQEEFSCDLTFDAELGDDLKAWVMAFNAEGLSSVSESLRGIIVGEPSPPRNAEVELLDGDVLVRWDPPEESGGTPITAYSVEGSEPWINCTTQGDRQCAIEGSQFELGGEYSFWVRAINRADFESEASKPTDFVVPSHPYEPADVEAYVREGELFVHWKTAAGRVEKDDISYRVTVMPGSMTCETSETWCHFAKVDNGTTYEVTVESSISMRPHPPEIRLAVSGSYVRSRSEIGESCESLSDPGFSDIAPGSWLANDIGCLVALGMIADGGDTTFDPQRPLTRAQFAELVADLWTTVTDRDCSLADVSRIYGDVPRQHPQAEAIGCLTRLGVVRGTGPGEFSPERLITRAEASVMVRQVLEAMTRVRCKAVGFFADVPKLSFFGSSVNCLKSKGIVNGTSSTTFAPLLVLERQYATALIARTFRVVLPRQ